jgi:hypothetical protein
MNHAMTRAVTAAALAALLGTALFVAGADAKKGKKGGGGGRAARVAKKVNKPIPNPLTDGNGNVVRDGAIAVPLKVKRAGAVKRVAVTVQTSGLLADAAFDLDARVTAPDGTTVPLWNNLAGQSIGPLTVVPNSPRLICSFNPAGTTPPPPPCSDPAATLNPPYLGTAGNAELNLLRGVPMRGKWTVTVYDRGTNGGPGASSILNVVRLAIS